MTEQPDWTPWAGGECPVAGGQFVELKYRGLPSATGVRIEWPCRAWRLAWYHDGADDDIIAYRIV